MTRSPEPAVEPYGPRLTWPELPDQVHQWVGEIIGDPVREATSQRGGFSPGVADRVRTRTGRRAFVKACGAATNHHTPDLLAREAEVLPNLPEQVGAPALLGWHRDDVDGEDWVVLVVEDIPGRHPHTPWTRAEVTAAVEAYRAVAGAPVPAQLVLPTLRSALAWESTLMSELPALNPAHLDPWVRQNLEPLIALADQAPQALVGNSIVHLDARSDNLLITAGGRLRVVDWPWACLGAPWFDILALALNVRLYDPGADLTAPMQAVTDLGAAPEQVDAVLAALLGYFSYVALQPPPPGLPTVRAFQQAQASTLSDWLRQRLNG